VEKLQVGEATFTLDPDARDADYAFPTGHTGDFFLREVTVYPSAGRVYDRPFLLVEIRGQLPLAGGRL
jgi:hypothetical protein